jgi:uncharacterized membrane protein YfcA
VRDASSLRNVQEQSEVDEIEAHFCLLPAEWPKANFIFSALPELRYSRQDRNMLDTPLLFIAAVFAFAGVVKGVIGLGLPTISMGLLATAMPPVQAAAILLLPSFITNVWQMISGPSLSKVLRRLWPMMLAVCAGTWAGLGTMTGTSARSGTALLGTALIIYAIAGLASWHASVPKSFEPIASPLVGAITGLITAATGVFVIPAVPYLQAIGLDKEELVQALGLSFSVSTVALAINVGVEGGLHVSMAAETIVALGLACAGMWFGQFIRHRLSQAAFRTWFFASLFLLGLYLIARSLT